MSDTITSATLRSETSEITVLSMGCAIQNWLVEGQPVVLGYDSVEDYRENPNSMGIIVGRLANRTRNSQFELNGESWTLPANDGPNHIHGGRAGLGWQNWTLDQVDQTTVICRLTSPHLDQGYPGAVAFEITLHLDGSALTWDMRAMPDRETPINLAQHVYFDLSGAGEIRDNTFRIAADQITPTGEDLIPTGAFVDVHDTRFDFRKAETLLTRDPDGLGYDLNYVLSTADGPQAEVAAPNGMMLSLTTDQPGLQFYTGGNLKPFGAPSHGATHTVATGFCLEAQGFPNAINQPGFGNILFSPECPYAQKTTIDIRKTR